MVITFCGNAKFFYEKDVEQKILNILKKITKPTDFVEFLLGGYGNFDFLAKKCANIFKNTHPNSKIVFVTPYINESFEKKLKNFKTEYDDIVYPNLETTPKRFAILKRNEWMIDKANFVIAFVSHGFGGAAKTFEYAKKKQKIIFNLGEN